MYVQIVVGILGILHDSSTVSVEVLLRALLEVSLDGVDTTNELPRIEHLRHLHLTTGALGDHLAPFRYSDRHEKLILLFNGSSLGCSSQDC